MTSTLTTRLMTASALLFGVAGFALIFEPVPFAAAMGLTGDSELPVSMWGAGILGFAALNWTARTSILGGIYGRAIVMGNAFHAFVGFLTLLRFLQDSISGTGWPLAAMMGVYLLNSVLFLTLQFNSPKGPPAAEPGTESF